MPVFLAWLIWFVVGEITLYQMSDQFALTRDGLIAVTFEEGVPPLIAGSPGRVTVIEDENERTLPAHVHRYISNPDGSTVTHLYVEELLGDKVIAEAGVEVDSVSPVRFLWQLMDGEE